MNTFKKQYQLWTYSDGGYHPTEFDTLGECLIERYTTDFYITKKTHINVTDAENLHTEDCASNELLICDCK